MKLDKLLTSFSHNELREHILQYNLKTKISNVDYILTV